MLRGNGRRGVALVVVLGLLVVLGIIAGEMVRTVRLEAHTVASLRARTVGRYAAESGILLAERELTLLLDSVSSPAERVAALNDLGARFAPLSEVALGSGRVGVTVVDLNARLDLNRSDTTTLRNLFAQFTDGSRAGAIAAAIRAAPLARLAELTSIADVDPALALRVAPYVTLWGDGSVNVNSAAEPVLAALPALGPAGAQALLQRRASGERFTSYSDVRPGSRAASAAAVDPDIETMMGGGAPTSAIAAAPALHAVMAPTRLLVISRGWQQGHPLTHEIQTVYALAGGGLQLLSWVERDR